MKSNSRITKSLKNAKVALVFYFVNLLLQFFYRKIFLDFLGSEVLGLNTTAMNLLQFLNLAELGVGAAVSYSLYKPLAINDHQEINEIVSIQGYLYSKIGVVVLLAGMVLMLFFPVFFSDIKVPLWYAYATFGVLFLSALIGYFLNYQQILLVSDQKEYKLNYAIQGVKILKIILQIFSILLLSNGYVWWLFWELIAVFVTVIGIKYMVKLEYPWLKTNIYTGKELIKKHPEITSKTKQLIAHKFAGFALNESGQLIIFAFTSLSFIAVYGNYLLVIAGITALLGAVFNSTNAGVGNLVSEGDKDKVLSVFEELFTVRFFLAVVSCYSVYKLTPVFITYWVGEKYILENSSLILLVLIMFVNITRLTVDSFLNAYGLFKDIAAPIIELIINIGLSLFLGYFYGFNGVLIGVIVSLGLIVLSWKPYFLFKSGFQISVKYYIVMYSKLLLISFLVVFITEFLMSLSKIDPNTSVFQFILYSSIIIVVFSSLLLGSFMIFTKGMRQFFLRFKIYFIK
jgi:O-antigen/teichoic acid export membrane protein